MNKYIWLNPVVYKMYDHDQLNSALSNLGFHIVTCEQNHLKSVKDKYKAKYESCKHLLCDNRCPKAVNHVKAHYDHDSLEYADIKPILIHCAEELADRYKHEDATLYIITPCTDLRNLGNSLKLPHTVFQTWTEFCRDNSINIDTKSTESSPIPPGFFDNIPNTVSLASKEEIDRFFKWAPKQEKQLIEMLYCPGGCHNGDGVRLTSE